MKTIASVAMIALFSVSVAYASTAQASDVTAEPDSYATSAELITYEEAEAVFMDEEKKDSVFKKVSKFARRATKPVLLATLAYDLATELLCFDDTTEIPTSGNATDVLFDA